jgi:hypothetical protein
MFMLGHMKDPVDGTATLVGYTETGKRHRASLEVLAQLTLRAPGMEEIPADITLRIPHSELPIKLGQTWNVRFERTQPSHAHFEWTVKDELDRNSRHEMERQLSVDEVRILEATRRRGSK